MDHIYLFDFRSCWGWWVLESNRTYNTIKLGYQVGVECYSYQLLELLEEKNLVLLIFFTFIKISTGHLSEVFCVSQDTASI